VNRTPPTRLAALLLAVLFLLSGVESAFGMVTCPHHDLLAAGGGGHMMHQMAGHGGHGAHEKSGDHPTPHSGQAPCTCQGACQMGSPAVVPTAAVSAPVASLVVVELPPISGEQLIAPRRSPFFLPYSQAPPRVG
jgi:hypothetical protein